MMHQTIFDYWPEVRLAAGFREWSVPVRPAPCHISFFVKAKLVPAYCEPARRNTLPRQDRVSRSAETDCNRPV